MEPSLYLIPIALVLSSILYRLAGMLRRLVKAQQELNKTKESVWNVWAKSIQESTDAQKVALIKDWEQKWGKKWEDK